MIQATIFYTDGTKKKVFEGSKICKEKHFVNHIVYHNWDKEAIYYECQGLSNWIIDRIGDKHGNRYIKSIEIAHIM